MRILIAGNQPVKKKYVPDVGVSWFLELQKEAIMRVISFWDVVAFRNVDILRVYNMLVNFIAFRNKGVTEGKTGIKQYL